MMKKVKYISIIGMVGCCASVLAASDLQDRLEGHKMVLMLQFYYMIWTGNEVA